MRIAVIGPQNTGKSTLIKDLLEKLEDYSTPTSSYRDVAKSNNIPINENTTEKSQGMIRDFILEQISSSKETNIIFDRCLIDNYVYSLAVLEDKSFLAETEKMMNESMKFLDGLVYIPTSLSVKLEADSLRSINTEYIDKVNRLFIELLIKISRDHPINILVVNGNRQERVEKILDWINRSK